MELLTPYSIVNLDCSTPCFSMENTLSQSVSGKVAYVEVIYQVEHSLRMLRAIEAFC